MNELDETNLEEKIKRLNLLPITETMKTLLDEMFPTEASLARRAEPQYDFVRFFQGSVMFYTRKYLEEHSLDELIIAFMRIVNDRSIR